MGTVYAVRMAALPAGISIEEIAALVDAELLRVNAAMSTYDPLSELSRFNDQSTTDWFPVSSELASVVKQAQDIARITDGAFDVTAGPLVDLWGFGPQLGDAQPPSLAALDAARASVGFTQLQVRHEPPALMKRRSELRADLSAIAKGYGVDLVARRLEAIGVRDYLVEIGGELRARGQRPDGKPWQVGIEKPDSNGAVAQQILPMSNGALATSGDYQNYFSKDGRRYSHIIDPRSGSPISHGVAAVTVYADDCARADGWATALSVLGPEAGLAMAEQERLAALFVLREGENFTRLRSSEFKRAFPDD